MRWTRAASIATYPWPDGRRRYGSGGAADPRPGERHPLFLARRLSILLHERADRRLRSVAMSREECREPVAGVPEGHQCGGRRRPGRTPGACRGENAGGSGTIISNASCPTGIIRNRCASSTRRRSCLRQHDLQSAVTQRQGLLSDFDDPNVPDVTCFIS